MCQVMVVVWYLADNMAKDWHLFLIQKQNLEGFPYVNQITGLNLGRLTHVKNMGEMITIRLQMVWDLAWELNSENSDQAKELMSLDSK